MILLSERLKAIKSKIENSESVADIGTDHGYLLLSILEDIIASGDYNHSSNGDKSKNPAVLEGSCPLTSHSSNSSF